MAQTLTIPILIRRAVALIALIAFLLGGSITHLHAGSNEANRCCGDAGVHATDSDQGEPSRGRHDESENGSDPHCGCACHTLLTIPGAPAPAVGVYRDHSTITCACAVHLGNSPAYGIFQPPRHAA